MENYGISREQANVISAVKNNSLTCIHYLDKFNLSSTCLHICDNYLIQGQRVLLLIESPEIIQMLRNKANEFNLSNLFLFLEKDDFLEETIQARIKTAFKYEVTGNVSGLKKEITQLEDRITNVFSAINEKVFGERSWIDLTLLKERTDLFLNTHKLKFNLKLTQQEFWHIRGKIEEAKSLYNNGHLINENILSDFNLEIDSDDSIGDFKELLVSFKVRMEKILLNLDRELSAYRQRIYKKLEEEYCLANNLCDELELDLEKPVSNTSEKEKSSFKLLKSKNTSKSPQFNK